MAASAILTRAHTLRFNVVGLDDCVERIGSGKMVRAGGPLLIDCAVTPGRAAGLGTDKHLGGNYPAGIRASIGGNKICDGESSLPACDPDRGCADRKNQDAQRQWPRQLRIAALRKFTSRNTIDDVKETKDSECESGHQMNGMDPIGNEDSPHSLAHQPQAAESQRRPAYSGPQSGAPPAGGLVAIGRAPVLDENHRERDDGCKADDDVEQQDPLRDHAIACQPWNQSAEREKNKNGRTSPQSCDPCRVIIHIVLSCRLCKTGSRHYFAGSARKTILPYVPWL